jgi:APA family basic amino acid/polyamine antiporter
VADAPGTQPVLQRRLGVADAVVIGLGAMLGAGVFASFGPAARAAGAGLVLALAVAAVVAYCNAMSSARLAAVHPQAGGTYVYGRRQLGPGWGFVAGWSFVVGKTASGAAMALTAGAYAWPAHPRPVALAAAAALTAVNYRGVTRTVALTRVLVAVTLLVLAVVVLAGWVGGHADSERLHPLGGTGPYGVLQAAGLLFFAFAGYARIATLGEEVRDPARTIPRAVPLALGLVVAVYAAVAVTALAVLGAHRLAVSPAALRDVVSSGSWHVLAPVVRVGAVTASLGVLLSLLAGVGRTSLAMARDGELPRVLDAIHPRFAVPHRAELTVGILVLLVVAVSDVRGAIGFSSFGVLVYYAVANASAWTLPPSASTRVLAGFGFLGCLTLAATLPRTSVVAGLAVLAVGLVTRAVVRALRHRSTR